MAFWLARERRAQHHSHIQRFDPHFWTVDFPRPAMASVVTTGPDSMRIDCEYHHQGELAGLIWDSTDRLDHPLLAYETHLDYSRTTLSFRWQSDGLIPLDQVNGPTLTIEGRDEAGNAKSWFVRLWNYADGTPNDAVITLNFSNLGGGWFLPGDPVHPEQIERMFISLVPPGYQAGSSNALPQRANGSATVSQIRCDGQNAMLEIGDVFLPVHGERIATAYDDAYNQTPARLVRSAIGLGYREEVLHYVGMSHFPRLDRNSAGQLEVAQPAQLCTPAREWHASLFSQCREHGLDTIVSLSFELFDAYCPAGWKQRAHDGEAAQTGWSPPSTLLSPASAPAVAWLEETAAVFSQLQAIASQPVKFQIGEPWWWVMQDGRPCIYDAAASAAYTVSAPVIADMREPLDTQQQAQLDEAGDMLGAATSQVAEAVRSAAGETAEIRLLLFTPTILDPQMPQLRRANLPAAWAYPAYDRLQVEDYDWLVGGADALRRAAYAEIDQELGYPADSQDYLAGFVLGSQDADTLWPRIDRGLDEAASRAVPRRFVWALPQVARDGYTRLAPTTEEIMQAFDEVLYPFELGRTAAVSPEFSTSVVVTASGHERRNTLWSDARLHFDVGPGIRSEEELSQLIAFFRARRGAARGFLITDPFDNTSNGMTGEITASDQFLGEADGVQSRFALAKRYGESDPQVRRITRPRAGSVRVSIDDTEVFDWALASGGIVEFEVAPPVGTIVRAGFRFDIAVRFAEDRIDVSGFNFSAGEAPSIPLVEIREAC